MNKFMQRILSHLPSAGGLAAYRRCRQSLNREPINFAVSRHQEDGEVFFMAKSVNFAGGAIITSGKTLDDINQNIKDAIFTAFGVPARYCDYRALKSDLPVAELQKLKILASWGYRIDL